MARLNTYISGKDLTEKPFVWTNRHTCLAQAMRARNRRKANVVNLGSRSREVQSIIRKLKTGEYRLYSRKVNPKTGKRRNLGTFKSRAAAEKHERDVQYFKRH